MASHRHRERGGESSIGGDFWASYSDLMAGLLLVFIFVSAIAHASSDDKDAQIKGLLEDEKIHQIKQWRQAVSELCNREELKAHKVVVDCQTGKIELSEGTLFDYDSAVLKPEGKEVLRSAVPLILDRLKESAPLWGSWDEVEVRGHSDPRANRDDPYGRNLRKSQQRAFAVLHFLATDSEIVDEYREMIREKAIASGASAARPNCREETKGCYAERRRVELIFGFRDREVIDTLYETFEKVLSLMEQNG